MRPKHHTAMKNEIPMGIVTERDVARMVGFSAKFFADMLCPRL
jgi:hypothetical protein